MNTKTSKRKMARYQAKPFESGNGIRHEPGYYTWTEGQYAETLKQFSDDKELPPTRAFHNAAVEQLRGEGFTVIAPHGELPPTAA